MKLTSQKVLKGLEKLEEEELTNDVLQPLIELLHPGRIEYTHSPIEAGRDLVSFGRDCLNRPHILCIQVKAIKLSYGASAFNDVVSAAEGASRISVTLENGETSYPSEVWIITSKPFPEQKRRQLIGYINELSRKGIKVIAGEELAELLILKLPDIAAWLSNFSSVEVMNFLSELSIHKEGRAFGFSHDKNLEDFYVTTTLAPYSHYINAAIDNKIKVINFSKKREFSVRRLLNPNEFNKDVKELKNLISERIIKEENKHYFGGYDTEGTVKFDDSIEKIKARYLSTFLFYQEDFAKPDDFIQRLQTKKQLMKYIFTNFSDSLRLALMSFNKKNPIDAHSFELLIEELNTILSDKNILSKFALKDNKISQDIKDILDNSDNEETIIIANRCYLNEAFSQELKRENDFVFSYTNVEVSFYLKQTFQNLISNANDLIKKCPKELIEDVSNVKNALDFLSHGEKFLKSIPEEYKILIFDANKNSVSDSKIRIQITYPENILKLDKLVLIEGAPGCGKTTLLKMLAIKLINLDKKIVYLQCFKISPVFQNKSLFEIIQNFALGAEQIKNNNDTKNFILIVDGLDEAPFSISERILKDADNFSNIVVSTRTTHNTNIRARFLHIAVAPFNSDERDVFFSKWLGENTDNMKKAKDLIKKYKDIDVHTRIPLIATITVALIQKGYQPRTRAEIYGNRLDLLLSNWDKLRGVKRLKIDYPDAKRRFLRELAYRIHSDSIRRRENEDLSILRGRQVTSENLISVYEDSLGNWGYGVNYKQLFDDLIVGSGILIEERQDVYSFGHLTFQEHLVGEYISENFKIYQIVDLLGKDWWKEALNFYASIRGNITELIESSMSGGFSFLANIEQINEMVQYAPYTSPGAIDCVKDSISSNRRRMN